jgi:hypothetical protein
MAEASWRFSPFSVMPDGKESIQNMEIKVQPRVRT